MLKINKPTYEIWAESIIDGLTFEQNEVLVDGLTFDEAAELCAIYQDFFGESVCIAIRETTIKKAKVINPAYEYKCEYMEYMAECFKLDNIL